MTSASFAERHRWHDPLVSRLAHWVPGVWLASGILWIVVDLTAPSLLTRLLLAFVTVVVMGVLVYVEMAHRSHLCPLCAERIPENGPATARFVKPLLWTHHNNLRVLVRSLVVTTIGVVVGKTLGPEALAYASNYIALAIAVWSSQAYLTHRVHRPWCPYCGGWGGDDDPDVVPEPTPPSKTEQLS